VKPFLLLDRDGVVNEPPLPPERYILNIKQLYVRNRVIEEIVRIQKFASVAIVSNQQCIGKKLVTLNQVIGINDEINMNLINKGGSAVEFFICSHLEVDKCMCRKPKPGLLLQAINQFRNGDKRECIYIGDQESDFEAATKAGIRFQLVYDEQSTVRTLEGIKLSSF
jgi:D-glycero-D-manno-heptose 1,7-bisphosphate phosphatase